MRLDHKVAVVTGAASGIGAGIAERLVSDGASVVGFDINGEGVRALGDRLGERGSFLPIEGDVANEEDVRRAVERSALQFGSLDILVNNAAIELIGAVVDFSEADWERMLAVNLKGVFLFCKHAIPRMRGRGGAIVNISSVHAFVSYRGFAAYDASKSGLVGLTRALALDHGRDRIRINAICPGYVDAPLMHKWLSTLTNPEEAMRQILSCHPLGRIGTVGDIADAVSFLVSESASFITGASLVVDGGMTLAGH